MSMSVHWSLFAQCVFVYVCVCVCVGRGFVFVSVCLFVCVCVFVCVISNKSTNKKPHVSDLSKLDTLLYKTHSKVLLVLRYQGLAYVDP